MKRGKELKLDLFENYNIVYGSVDNKSSKAAYVNLSAWGQPQINEKINYDRVIKDINKKIKNYIYTHLSDSNLNQEYFKDKTIVDLDIRKSGIRFKKRSFVNAEIILFLTKETSINSDKIKHSLGNIIKLIINDVFESDKYFKFHKKKA